MNDPKIDPKYDWYPAIITKPTNQMMMMVVAMVMAMVSMENILSVLTFLFIWPLGYITFFE